MSIYLHKDDLETIIQFIEAINPEHQRVELLAKHCGIGTTITAKIHGVELNGMTVSVEKEIVGSESW